MSETTTIGNELEGDGSPDYLADAWQRLEWANRDGQTFERLSKWFGDTGAHAIWVEYQGDRWQATFRRLCDPAVEQKKLAEVARALGSFLDHSRAALNYTVYQLALLAIREDPALNSPDLPNKDRLRPETVEYPIVHNREQLRDHSGIRNLPDTYRTIIEAKQPYDGQNQGLRLLNELAREYRHRVVHPAAIAPIEDMHRVYVNDQLVETPDMEIISRERLADGDIILRFSLPGIEPGAQVYPQVAITVGIDHPLTRGRIGMGVLNEIGAGILPVISEIEAEFFPTQQGVRLQPLGPAARKADAAQGSGNAS